MSRKNREQRQGGFVSGATSPSPESDSADAADDLAATADDEGASLTAGEPSAPSSDSDGAGMSATARPTEDELNAADKACKSVLVVTLLPTERAKIAGLNVDTTPRIFALSRVSGCGPSYMRALATDERISVRIVES